MDWTESKDLGQIRTDLAAEAVGLANQRGTGNIRGVEIQETEEARDVTVTRVKVTTPEGAAAIGKPIGNYVTIDAPGLRYKDVELQEQVTSILVRELVAMAKLPDNASVLVVGLGNWNITPDALGPRVANGVVVTRHVHAQLSPEIRGKVRTVTALSPGVMGITGMETAEVIRGVVEQTKPDLIIAIDALASRAVERMITTIQLADTGINPGGGVGNRRMQLNQETLGIPVIAIGVPTVVYATTIANETIDALAEDNSLEPRLSYALQNLTPFARQRLLEQVLAPFLGDLVMTPKEIDVLIEDMAQVVTGGINAALHPGIDHQNIWKYMQV